MNRKELAMELDISKSTLGRRMKNLNPDFLEHIKNRSLLFENEIKYIHENIEWRTSWQISQGYPNVRQQQDTRFDD